MADKLDEVLGQLKISDDDDKGVADGEDKEPAKDEAGPQASDEKKKKKPEIDSRNIYGPCDSASWADEMDIFSDADLARMDREREEALEALRRAEEEEEVLEWRKNHPGDDRGPVNQNLSGSSDSTDTFAPQHFRRPYGGGYNDTVLDGDKTKPAGATGGNGPQQGRVGAYSRGERRRNYSRTYKRGGGTGHRSFWGDRRQQQNQPRCTRQCYCDWDANNTPWITQEDYDRQVCLVLAAKKAAMKAMRDCVLPNMDPAGSAYRGVDAGWGNLAPGLQQRFMATETPFNVGPFSCALDCQLPSNEPLQDMRAHWKAKNQWTSEAHPRDHAFHEGHHASRRRLQAEKLDQQEESGGETERDGRRGPHAGFFENGTDASRVGSYKRWGKPGQDSGLGDREGGAEEGRGGRRATVDSGKEEAGAGESACGAEAAGNSGGQSRSTLRATAPEFKMDYRADGFYTTDQYKEAFGQELPGLVVGSNAGIHVPGGFFKNEDPAKKDGKEQSASAGAAGLGSALQPWEVQYMTTAGGFAPGAGMANQILAAPGQALANNGLMDLMRAASALPAQQMPITANFGDVRMPFGPGSVMAAGQVRQMNPGFPTGQQCMPARPTMPMQRPLLPVPRPAFFAPRGPMMPPFRGGVPPQQAGPMNFGPINFGAAAAVPQARLVGPRPDPNSLPYRGEEVFYNLDPRTYEPGLRWVQRQQPR